MSEQSREKAIRLEQNVNANIKDVWDAWTTEEGVKSFFAPDCNIDLKVGGAYEMLFDLNAEPGLQGGGGLTLMALQPLKMLSFTWNAPPAYPNVRGQLTHVIVRFDEVSENETKVTLNHDGWGEGKEWEEVYDYFVAGWRDSILPRLKSLFDSGPFDWSQMSDG